MLCDECRSKRYVSANLKKAQRAKEKSMAYFKQLSKTVMFDTKKPKHPYGRTIEEKAIEWHEEWLRWADRNGVSSTQEYDVTKYALDCIMKCKQAREEALLQGDKAVNA